MSLNTTLSRAAAAVILTLSLATAGAAEPRDTSAIRIYNFAQVNDGYFRGGQPTAQDYADLSALGVKTIINLTSDDGEQNEQAMVEQHGMRYLHIPMKTRQAPTPAELDTFLAAVNDAATQPVYVHCVGGRHRTGVMTAVYRMTRDGLSAEQAFKEMKQFKYGPDFLHPEFKKFVYQYRPATNTAVATSQQQN